LRPDYRLAIHARHLGEQCQWRAALSQRQLMEGAALTAACGAGG
jgi:hypothetical protein